MRFLLPDILVHVSQVLFQLFSQSHRPPGQWLPFQYHLELLVALGRRPFRTGLSFDALIVV